MGASVMEEDREINKLKKHIQDQVEVMKIVLDKKANDYASEKDILSNFKNSATILKLPTEKIFLMLISTKLSRLVELLDGKQPENEPVKDTLLDMINYLFLLDYYLEKSK
jgi:hypothetical protein